MDRPPLPKRLASRIVAAQNKVTSSRDSIIDYDRRIKNSTAELAEFDADAVAYARKRYGNHGVDSYPVQTRIERQQEELDYRMRNLPRKYDELAAAEHRLADVEAEVLRELGAMRSNTPGRVPWPAPLPTFKRHRELMLEAWNRMLRDMAEQRARDDAAHRAWQAEEDARLAAESAREWQAWRDGMTPEERVAIAEWGQRFQAAIAAGKFTFNDFLEHLRNRNRGPGSSS
ncbi:hypothetical protein ACRS8P_27980 [Burkholderia cenocepacia]|uniref:hypothetical protein n=1 Tax=Burkholderia cepacia TaxID=292 RepID=UPI001589471F|nr:hypothetical protein [Burkholderia cepacia]MCA8162087.1 hypothetical protein [Burkholderia cepacia]